MARYHDCRFELICPEIELSDAATARRMVSDVVNSPAFLTMLEDLAVTAGHARGGAAPRGGEISAGCRADSGGGWSCEGRVSVRF